MECLPFLWQKQKQNVSSLHSLAASFQHSVFPVILLSLVCCYRHQHHSSIRRSAPIKSSSSPAIVSPYLFGMLAVPIICEATRTRQSSAECRQNMARRNGGKPEVYNTRLISDNVAYSTFVARTHTYTQLGEMSFTAKWIAHSPYAIYVKSHRMVLLYYRVPQTKQL